MAEYNPSSGQDLINITQGSAHGQGAGPAGGYNNVSVKAHHNSAKKFNQIYTELFALVTNSESYERRGKQSLLRGMLQQLEH